MSDSMSPTNFIGAPKEELDTPVLLVDLDKLEANIARMARIITKEAGVRWRPHTKAMKTPALAHMLLDAGASGITCAKLGEAEVMAAGGIRDILIANQIVGPHKISRLVNLRRHADVMVAVDCLENVDALDRAARDKGVCLRVLIEIDTGMNRAGVDPGEPALSLARHIAQRSGLHLSGLMTWESHALGAKDPQKKGQMVAAALECFTATAQMCRDAGIPMKILSCGGTGTYWISAHQPGITEIEAGGGIYCDVRYRQTFGVDHQYALTVLSTVTSRAASTRIICDAGRKTMSCDADVPEPLAIKGVKEVTLSAEHGKIELDRPTPTPRVGDKLEFIVGYSDTTVVLHNRIYGIRDGMVEAIWPLLGRGQLH